MRGWSAEERQAIYDAVVEFGENEWNLVSVRVSAALGFHGRRIVIAITGRVCQFSTSVAACTDACALCLVTRLLVHI